MIGVYLVNGIGAHQFQSFIVINVVYVFDCSFSHRSTSLIFSFQVVPVPDHELPVQLPPLENIQSTSKKGISSLAHAYEWMKTRCPK